MQNEQQQKRHTSKSQKQRLKVSFFKIWDLDSILVYDKNSLE